VWWGLHHSGFSDGSHMNLTVADGFKLGCGLILAAAFTAAVLVLAVALAVFVSALIGRPLPPPFS